MLWLAGANSESIDRQVGALKGTMVQSVLCQKLKMEMVGLQPFMACETASLVEEEGESCQI